MIVLLCGMLSGCTPKGYSNGHRDPIVSDTGSANDNTGYIYFHTFMTGFSYDPNEPNAYPKTTRNDFSYNDELYYMEILLNRDKQDVGSTEIWKYTVCRANGEYIGTLTSYIAKDAMIQRINISFLDEQYIYYECENSICVKQFVLTPDGFTQNVWYSRFAFFRFNLETYENEEITLSMLFEKLVPIHKKFLLEQEPPFNPVYDIKINPEYKGYKGKYKTGEKS